jgi:hypothetical protein
VIDEPTGKMFVTVGDPNRGRLAIIEIDTGVVRESEPAYVAAVDTDEERRIVFVLSAAGVDGGLQMVDADTENVGQTLPLSSGGLTSGFGVDPTTHDVYVGYLQGSQLQVFSGVDYSARTIVGQNGRRLVVDPAHGKVVGNLATFNGIWVYDRATDEVTVIYAVWDGGPRLYSAASGRIYGSSEIDENIAIYDGATNELTTMSFPPSVPYVAVTSTRHVFYVSERSTTVLVEDTLSTYSLPVPDSSPRGGAFYSSAVADQEMARVFVVNDADNDGVITVVDDAI